MKLPIVILAGTVTAAVVANVCHREVGVQLRGMAEMAKIANTVSEDNIVICVDIVTPNKSYNLSTSWQYNYILNYIPFYRNKLELLQK